MSVIAVVLVAAAIFMFRVRSQDEAHPPNGAITAEGPGAQGSQSASGSPQQGEVRGKRATTKTILPPSGDARMVIDGLKAQAEAGDATASLQIFLKIRECMSQLSSMSLEEREAREKTRIAEKSTKETEQALKDCEGLQGADYATRGKWLELAADNGSLEAQLLYVADSESIIGGARERLKDPDKVKRYKLKAQSFLENAANNGSVEALMELSDSYKKGIYVDRNLTNAYAYYKAAQMAEPRIFAADVIRSYESQLSPSELERGNALANSIYNNCCK